MSWTIGVCKQEHPELLDALMKSFGRALCIASGFDSTCKWLAQMFRLTDAIEEGETYDAARDIVNAYRKEQLAGAIARLSKSPECEEDIGERLDMARISRNYIAHEAAAMSISGSVRVDAIMRAFRDLDRHVINLAHGDNIAGEWAYEITEHEPAPIEFVRDYPKLVWNWVFEGTPLDPRLDWEIPQGEQKGVEGLTKYLEERGGKDEGRTIGTTR